MIIANPIYDVVFKAIMADNRTAKFFIETLLDEQVEDVVFSPQEYAYYKRLEEANVSKEYIEAITNERISIHVYRLDFIATIRTADGTFKKVLIEIQKARNVVDVIRFRNYLANQYKMQEEIETANGIEKVSLPIVTIYLLGFKLPELPFAAIKVNRQYTDMLTHDVIEGKSNFVEQLTHDCYIVQLTRIKSKFKTRLDKLLSVFEQDYFIDDTGVVKEFNHAVEDDPELKLLLDTLHYIVIDPKRKKELDDEREFDRTFQNAIDELEKNLKRKLDEKDKVINEKDKVIDAKDKLLEEKERLIQQLLQQMNTNGNK